MNNYMYESSGTAVRATFAGQNAEPRRRSPPVTGAPMWMAAIPLALITVAAFLPALDNGFVHWDDDKNFLANPYYRGLGAAQWKWAWSTFWLGVYQPLAWLLFEVQYLLWKLDPRGYHLTSLVLHTVNAVVLYMLTAALLRRSQSLCNLERPWTCSLAAGLATSLFAVHPLRVEPVVWASCQPYLPCALFSMLAVLAYLRAFETVASPRWGWLAVTFVLFVAALLSKAAAVSLPAVLLILDVYPLRRFGEGTGRWFGSAVRRACWEKMPFVLVSLVFMGVATAARRQALISTEHNDASESIALVCYGIWFYLVKTVLPLDLIAVYPAPKEIDWQAPRFIVGIFGTVAMSGVFFLVRRRWPGLLAAWLTYLVILAPNSGIIRINDQIAADRYSYLSTVALVVVTAGCFWRVLRTTARVRPAALGVIALGVGLQLVLIPMTWGQCRTWRNAEILWRHALNHGGAQSSLAHYNLSLILYRQGKLEAAAALGAEALRLDPSDVVAHNNLGVILQHQGKLNAAAARYAAALRLNPDYLNAHYNLAIVLSRQRDFAAAAFHFEEALRLAPGFADAHHNLGADFFLQGKLAEAAAHYTEALRLDLGRFDTHTNLGVVLSRQGRFEEAAAHYSEALRLNPGYAEALKNLEIDHARQRKLEDTAAH
jgi:protein O-mannosyl-transferase